MLQKEQEVKISWFAAISTSGFINLLDDGHKGYKRWFACFVAEKKVKYRSFVIFWKYQGKALKFVVVVCIVYMQRGTNLPRRSESQKPSKQWHNFNRSLPRRRS